ncbi:glycosyltransferase [Aminobacter sp. BE322]|uniref:glycosyltransferase n=1 Tax=unclassified Aminobacter TaxID=2644704 RepID=UPI003D19432A
MPRSMLTIAICTHNRSTDLAECLQSLLGGRERAMPPVLVVDSASSESERLKIAAATAQWPQASLIRVERPGLATARNAALAATRTDWIAYLDDDVVAADDWIDEALHAVRSAPPDCAIVGGRVDPICADGQSRHIGPRWRQLLSLTQVESDAASHGNVGVVGANVIFRREPLLAVGAFSPQLGRMGEVLLSGEEKLVVECLRKQGATILHNGRMRVGHKIPRERLERGWAARRAYWDGITDQKIRRMQGERVRPAALLKLLASLPVLGLAYFVPSPRQEFFLRFWYDIGYLRELFASVALPADEPAIAAELTDKSASRAL